MPESFIDMHAVRSVLEARRLDVALVFMWALVARRASRPEPGDLDLGGSGSTGRSDDAADPSGSTTDDEPPEPTETTSDGGDETRDPDGGDDSASGGSPGRTKIRTGGT